MSKKRKNESLEQFLQKTEISAGTFASILFISNFNYPSFPKSLKSNSLSPIAIPIVNHFLLHKKLHPKSNTIESSALWSAKTYSGLPEQGLHNFWCVSQVHPAAAATNSLLEVIAVELINSGHKNIAARMLHL